MCGPWPEQNQSLPSEKNKTPRVGRRALLGAAALMPAGMAFAPPATASNTSGKRKRRPTGKLELVLLGTKAGPPVDPLRTGISSALVVDGKTYVIDAGRSAVTQYIKAGLKFSSLNGIFLTHLHADHLADYYNFFLLAGSVPNQEGDTLPGPVPVWGPGAAGGLPPKFGGGTAPTIAPHDPTPGTIAMTERLHEAYAYSTNIFLRDMGIRDIRELAQTNEIKVPNVGQSYLNPAPGMKPFKVMEDDRVRVSAILVPHGPIFPSFAFRFDTDHGSVTFSGDTTYTENMIRLARRSDVLVHEAINVRGWSNGTPVFVDHLLQSHVEVQEVGPIAQRSEVPHLVLSHISDLRGNPLLEQQWRRWAQVGYQGRVTIGNDLQRIRIA